MLLSSFLLLILTLGVINGEENYPRAKTPLGAIRGYYKKSENGRLYAAYEGIPYALPPIGELRFQSPQKINAWEGELQATKVSDVCLQYLHVPQSFPSSDPVQGNEDCLYLNVYVPVRETDSTPMPVLFWIHGGAFQFGSGTVFGAKYLADEDVILVTINYRLGPLGFLSTEDEVVPGNMGLKDQSMALRWVHDNIEWFEGDPNKITLVGLSAGGASVHYHYLTPLSAGLFQSGISISGTTLVCWAQAENSLEKAKKLGALMGCPTDDVRDMIECLKQRPGRPLVQATSEFMPWLYNPYTPFGPVVEKSTENYFINESPIDIITSGKAHDVPWITGVVSEEGLYPVAEFITDQQHMKYLNDNWDSLAKHLLDYNYTLPQEEHPEISDKIRKHYLGSKPIDRLNAKAFTLMVGDRLFVTDAEKAARLQAKSNKSPVWFYYYSYRAAESLSDFMSGTKENLGVSHADDSYLVIENPYLNPRTTEQDKKMQKDLLKFWTSIASTGKPDMGVELLEVDPTKEDFDYLHISGPGRFVMKTSDNLGEKKFWDTVKFNENKFRSQSAKEEL